MARTITSQTAAQIVATPQSVAPFARAQRFELIEYTTQEAHPVPLDLIVVPRHAPSLQTCAWPTFSFAGWWKVEVEFTHGGGGNGSHAFRSGQVYDTSRFNNNAASRGFTADLPAHGLRMQFGARAVKVWIRVIGEPSAWSGFAQTIHGSIQEQPPGFVQPPHASIARQSYKVYDATVNAGNSIQTNDVGNLVPIPDCAREWRIHSGDPSVDIVQCSGQSAAAIRTDSAGDLGDWAPLHPDAISWLPTVGGGSFTATTAAEIVTADFR